LGTAIGKKRMVMFDAIDIDDSPTIL